MALGVGLFILVVVGAVVAYALWQRGGAARPPVDAPARRQYALAVDEAVLQTYAGALYFGRLRPDVTRADFDQQGAMSGSPARGEALTFAFTDRARLAVSRGPAPDTRTPNPPQLPFRLWGPPGLKPRVQRAAEAFPGSPYLEEAERGPHDAKGGRQVLLHFVAPDGPLTVWIDPEGAQAIEEWISGPARQPTPPA